MNKPTRTLSLKRELLEIVLIFIFGALVNYGIWCEGCRDDLRILYLNVVTSGSFWVCLWKGSQYMVIYLDRIMPWFVNPLKRLIVSFLSVILYTTIVVYCLDLLIDVFFMNKSISDALERLNYASLSFAILLTLGINTFMHGRGFLLGWRQAAIDNERLKTEQVATQYNSLKNQVNPHFLFNSFNALSSLVYEDQDKAVEFIRKLSQVYRYVLDRKDEELVPLTEEMDFVRNFVYLQQIRFGDNLIVEMEGDESNAHVPPLAIQLLIENAIKHNVVSEKDPLKIQVLIAHGHCIVQNSLKEKKSKDSTGIGLDNLIARYEYLSEKPVEVTKTEVDFKVTVPLLTLDS